MSTTTSVSSSLSSKNQSACTPSTASQTPQLLPPGFDSPLAYLLGLCCNAANDQYTANVENTAINQQNPFDPTSWQIDKVLAPKPWNPDFSQIVAQGYKPNPAYSVSLSAYETDINGKYVEVPAGFIVRLDSTDTNKSMIVVAFHGTQNSYELKIDNYIVPATFGGLLGNLGSVHGGFYAQYTNGTSGNAGNLVARADGSLAKQIYDYFSKNGDTPLPVKVTGHSLGGALATLCALDIAYNFKPNFKSISMYSLASPRVADAWSQINPGSAGTFVSNYQQYVPDSYRIVNTLDTVPTLPYPLTPPVLTTNRCAHVLGDELAILFGIVNPSLLDLNVVSFTDANTVNGADSQQECQGAHSCPAVYVPFLERLAHGS